MIGDYFHLLIVPALLITSSTQKLESRDEVINCKPAGFLNVPLVVCVISSANHFSNKFWRVSKVMIKPII